LRRVDGFVFDQRFSLKDFVFNSIGQSLQRNEDERLITGKGRFTDDFSLPEQTWAWMVRSTHPHAWIKSIDTSAAMQMPGVLAVFTGKDCLNDQLNPIEHNPVPSTQYDVKLRGPNDSDIFLGYHHLLPFDKVRHVGQALAMVVARTRNEAFSAAQMVMVQYEELPKVMNSEFAIHPDAPIVWDELPSNVLVDATFGDIQATEKAFEAAEHIVCFKSHVSRVTGVTMEPRACLGHYDPKTDRYTLFAGNGGAVRQKSELAKVLGVEADRLRVISHDVGGNFGTRNRAYVEFGLVLWASKKLGFPVKHRADRTESFLSDYQGRDLVTEVQLALNAKGKFLALKVDNLSNVGYCCVSLSPLSKGSGLVTGSYDIATATLRSRAVFTNTMATQAYRSSGRPEVTFAIERVIDRAARVLGIDRLELRRLNLVQAHQMPYTNAIGSSYDSGEYEENMNRILELSDWSNLDQRRQEAHARGKLLGAGFANYVESSIGSPKERAEIIVHPTQIEVIIGTQPAGQGHETSFAQVAADLLGVEFNRVFITLGDTDIVTAGGGTHSGRSLRHASAVIALAVEDLRALGVRHAAHFFNCKPEDVLYENGHFKSISSVKSVSWFDLSIQLANGEGPQSSLKELRVLRDNEMHTPVYPNGACVCEIEIDPETGGVDIKRYSAVDDVGRCINPLIVHGQTHGGIAQGVGQALWEECYLDQTSGQPIACSLMDYGMPRFDNLPSFKTEIVEVLSPTNPFGIKAGGEGGTTPALAVVMSAVEDALWPVCGPVDFDLPATPQKIWNALQRGKAH
jgi:carbon-monoxide dehydrogenase large subunit